MLQILFPRHGAVLNHNHGKETEESLLICVRGKASIGSRVTVNGIEATRKGSEFSAEIPLTAKFNDIRICSQGNFGEETSSMKVLWDKKSFLRSNFYIDDHSFFLTDISLMRPKSLFDHFYLAGLKGIHERQGTKFTLNCFYRNDHDKQFTLDQFPDCYRSEFADNADWLRLSFHAYSEFPDRCYEEPGSGVQILKDYQLVRSEIERFAGPATFIMPPVIHWAVASRDSVKAMAEAGQRCFSGGYRGVKDVCFAALEKGLNPLECDLGLNPADIADIGYGMRFEDAVWLFCHRKLYDFELGMMYQMGAGVCCNMFTPQEIIRNFKKCFALPYGNECFGLASHEQYTFPYYRNYIPDHLQRIETAAQIAKEHGCTPVFFQEGLLGNMSWE